MKQITLFLILFFSLALHAGARQTLNFCFDWQFSRDSATWQTVNLPHDFQISQPWVAPAANEKADNSDVASNVKSRLSARGFKEMGTGYYRKVFNVPAEWKGRRVVVCFGGIMLTGDVYLNGERIGGTNYGYVDFEIDLTNRLKYGADNVMTVKASTMKSNNSRWYTGGGLFRAVNLLITSDDLYFTRHPLKITTLNNRQVNVQAEIGYFIRRTDTLQVKTRILDATGQCVAQGVTPVPFNRTQKICEHPLAPITLPDAHLWSCEHPYLYTAEVSVYRSDGSLADQVSEPFGVRTLEYSPEWGLKINGEKVLLKGIANHHTLGALGAAAYPRAIEKRLQLLKQFGVNCVRTSHNPYSTELLDLCDRYGILVVDELYDKWTEQYAGGRTDWKNLWQNDIPEWVKRDRNHPSVVMWSLGNELQQIWNLPFHDWGVTIYKMQHQLLQRYDSLRPVTVAMHPRYRDADNPELPAPLARVTDVASYNYRYMYFPGDGKRYPWMKFFQSEASVANMGPNFFEMDRNKVVGLAYWGLIDYLGESQGWPLKGWSQGVFDISLQPKPKAYLLKSIFTTEPVVHIGIVERGADNALWNGVNTSNAEMSENWNRKPGSHVTLYTYTNADEVELLLNGKSLGVQKNSSDPKQRNQIKWTIDYAPGRLTAIARTAGKQVAAYSIETTGEPVKLIATPDNNHWRADGMDLQHISITAVDSKGRVVPMAGDSLQFHVTSNAELVAACNGDISSNESFTEPHHSLWRGRALVILRAGRQAGNVTFTAESNKYKKLTLKLRTTE